MKHLIFISLFFVITCNSYSQTKDEMLRLKLKDCTEDHINLLVDYNIIANSDINLMAICLDEMTKRNVDVENLTLGQFVDSLNLFKKEMYDIINSTMNFGNDSVCFRNADGEKVYLGKGELSMEKLVARESQNLPTYFQDEKLNTLLGNSEAVTNIITELDPDKLTLSLISTVIFIFVENGKNLNDYKIGELLEIVNRLKNSKELQPFLEIFK